MELYIVVYAPLSLSLSLYFSAMTYLVQVLEGFPYNIEQYIQSHMHTHTVHIFQQVNTRALKRVTRGTLKALLPVVIYLGSIPHYS